LPRLLRRLAMTTERNGTQAVPYGVAMTAHPHPAGTPSPEGVLRGKRENDYQFSIKKGEETRLFCHL